MEHIIAENNVHMTNMKRVDIGVLNCFDYSLPLERIAFLDSLTQIIVTPCLHWNMIKFLGIS